MLKVPLGASTERPRRVGSETEVQVTRNLDLWPVRPLMYCRHNKLVMASQFTSSLRHLLLLLLVYIYIVCASVRGLNTLPGYWILDCNNWVFFIVLLFQKEADFTINQDDSTKDEHFWILHGQKRVHHRWNWLHWQSADREVVEELPQCGPAVPPGATQEGDSGPGQTQLTLQRAGQYTLTIVCTSLSSNTPIHVYIRIYAHVRTHTHKYRWV